MHCAAARATYDPKGKDGGPAVILALGELRLRRAGEDTFQEDAWTNLSVADAETLAADLIEAARKLRARNR